MFFGGVHETNFAFKSEKTFKKVRLIDVVLLAKNT